MNHNALVGEPAWAFETRYPLFTRVAIVGVWCLGLLTAAVAVYRGVSEGYLGEDAHAYWVAARDGISYGRAPGTVDAYLYSPAFALLVTPLALLPWPAFLAVWIAIDVAALVWLLRHVHLRWAIPFFLLCVPELVVGNVFLLIAACLAAGLRAPGLWAFPLLTKVTTGIGLLWFAFRRDWRPLVIAAITTAVIVGVCALIDPGAWREWFAFLTSNTQSARDGRIGFALRLVVAVAVMWWGARTGRAWTIAVAAVLAAPVSNLMTLTMLTAVPRLAAQRAPALGRRGDPGQQAITH